jgi:hypothetical protein
MLRRLDLPAVELEGSMSPPFWVAKLPITLETNGSESSRYNGLQTWPWRRVVCICSWETDSQAIVGVQVYPPTTLTEETVRFGRVGA